MKISHTNEATVITTHYTDDTATMSQVADFVAKKAPQAQVKFMDGGPVRPDCIIINGKAITPGGMIEIFENGSVVASTNREVARRNK